MSKSFSVVHDGKKIGVVYWQTHFKSPGYRFAPLFQGLHSRKLWDTPEQAIRGRVPATSELIPQ